MTIPIGTLGYNEIQMILPIGTSGYDISEYILKLQIHQQVYHYFGQPCSLKGIISKDRGMIKQNGK